MMRPNRKTILAGGLACAVLALASCGPDDGSVGTLDHFSLGPTAAWPEDGALGGFNAEPPFPDAVPMLASYDAGGYSGAAPQAGYRGYASAPAYYDSYDDYGAVPQDYYYDGQSGGVDGYELLGLAATVGAILGSAPPDYAFGYSGVQPWAWRTGDNWVRYAEPVGGSYRYYYYEPNQLRPFLVRDRYYSYGYRGDNLVAIYDRSGRMINPSRAWKQRRVAQRYYDRGFQLYEAGSRTRRYGVAAPLWSRERDRFVVAQRDWDRARDSRDNWRAWDRRHRQVVAARWTQERLARDHAAERFAQWQKADYRGKAPAFYREAAADRKLRQQVRKAQVQAMAARSDLRDARADTRRLSQRFQAEQREDDRQIQQLRRQQAQLGRNDATQTRRDAIADRKQRITAQRELARDRAAEQARTRDAKIRAKEAARQDVRAKAKRVEQQRLARQTEAKAKQSAQRVAQQREARASEQRAQRQQAAKQQQAQRRVAQQREARASEQRAQRQQAAKQQQAQRRVAQQRDARASGQRAQRQQAMRQDRAQQRVQGRAEKRAERRVADRR